MSQTVFNRVEKKYMLPKEVYLMLLKRLNGHMEVDEYGLHTICNLYYDTQSYGLIRRSIDKPLYKEKLRLRSYGVPTLDSKVFVEIKKKYDKVVNKRRVQMTLREAYDYVERGIRPEKKDASWGDLQIMNEIDFFLQRYPLRRGMFLAYDRVALKGVHDDFRLTFDMRIRNRIGHMGLEYGDSGENLLPGGYALMETKVMGATPLWFSNILAELAVYPTSFSKYGNFYKKDLHQVQPVRQLTHRLENWEEQLGLVVAGAAG
ncbi:MAG: polyphosphate polymerase domain-containing protein [Lachnospiraceae bacterium]|nr:polyphosphate polymerase domain-containing protein [Lachnospiraceae bacterium]